jgi:hypothetical protein
VTGSRLLALLHELYKADLQKLRMQRNLAPTRGRLQRLDSDSAVLVVIDGCLNVEVPGALLHEGNALDLRFLLTQVRRIGFVAVVIAGQLPLAPGAQSLQRGGLSIDASQGVAPAVPAWQEVRKSRRWN